MRAARSWALAASRVSLAACVRTRRPVDFDGVVRVVLARRADGLRAAGLRFAAAGFFAVVVVVFVVVLVVFSAMLALAPCPEVSGFFLRPYPYGCSRRTYVRKPKSWTSYSGLPEFVSRIRCGHVKTP